VKPKRVMTRAPSISLLRALCLDTTSGSEKRGVGIRKGKYPPQADKKYPQTLTKVQMSFTLLITTLL